MKILIGVGGSGMLLGSLYATDALTAGQVYDVPLEQAYSELSSMPLPETLVRSTGGAEPASVAVERSPRAIDWRFQVAGQEVAVFTASLSPEGADRTRVRIAYTAAEPPSPELGQLTSTALVRDLARIAMTEQVSAELEDRPVDRDRIVDALARHAAAHPEQVHEFSRGAGQMVAGLRGQIYENSKDLPGAAEASEAPVPLGLDHSAMNAATRPSVELPTSQ